MALRVPVGMRSRAARVVKRSPRLSFDVAALAAFLVEANGEAALAAQGLDAFEELPAVHEQQYRTLTSECQEKSDKNDRFLSFIGSAP